MKKIFIAFSFILLFVVKTFGQAAVDISLSATDGTVPFQLSVGLDLTATNCIDPQLGESDPPIPPPGSYFFILFDLSPYGCPSSTHTFKDYRAPGNPPIFPFTGLIEHTLWWQTSAPALPIDITYNLPPGTLMFITDQINGSFLNLGPFIGQGTATIPGSYTAIFAKAFLKMQYDNIVPVELTSFTASILQNEKAAQLNWATATETNNSGFEIQRLQDSKIERLKDLPDGKAGWEAIGFVPGFGTTTEPKSYSFIDEDVTTGIYKYRLKQIDFDGSFTYSNEIEVEVDYTPKEFMLYQNYPNPFNPSTTIKFTVPSVIASGAKQSHLIMLKVYDILGNEVATLVNEEKQPGVYEVEFNSTGLSSGIYFYQLKGGSFTDTKKLMLLR